MLGDEALEMHDRHRLVELATPAAVLAGVAADTATHRGEGVGAQQDPVRVVEALGPRQRAVLLLRDVFGFTQGQYLTLRREVDGQDLGTLSEAEENLYRRDRIGFIFQSFNLIPLLDVTENVALPFTIAGRIAATGQRATTDGRSHILATRS